MIATSNAGAVFARLVGRARLLGETAAEQRRLAATDPARRWRRAALLWPLFTKG